MNWLFWLLRVLIWRLLFLNRLIWMCCFLVVSWGLILLMCWRFCWLCLSVMGFSCVWIIWIIVVFFLVCVCCWIILSSIVWVEFVLVVVVLGWFGL